MSAELGALLLTDGRLPTGGHAHSAGLEPALAAGLRADQVPAYIDARLRTVGLVEAAAAVVALRIAVDAPARLGDVQAELMARTPSAPLRHASELLGRGLARLALRLWPDHAAVAALHGLGQPPLRPVALGVVGAALGMSAAAIARASLYDDAQTVAAASLKLLPVDPADATGWLLASASTIEAVVSRALATTGPDDLPALTAPMVELWSLDHHHSTRRIFVS
ncbi:MULTISPECIES: urease accessory protein UreF [unclassified Nocardioides]|uniref:urease accessory protein UreF n=1 Tax=unclassified Nocardioides TaxID=2615069 RepID=UPI0006F9AF03|nr:MULTISPECIES: urease accessory UreF family protein [unclassified Nocardioides]KQY57690.1 urease accessory protein [Nocardioides sp. Root140]KRF13225.1 urease accessory protein [Nocardioides sp. Soil796]